GQHGLLQRWRSRIDILPLQQDGSCGLSTIVLLGEIVEVELGGGCLPNLAIYEDGGDVRVAVAVADKVRLGASTNGGSSVDFQSTTIPTNGDTEAVYLAGGTILFYRFS